MVFEGRRLSVPETALWVGLYVAAGVLSSRFTVWPTALAPSVWLPTGVSLAAMLLSPSSAAGCLAVAFALAQSVLSHFSGRDIQASLVLGGLAGATPLIASAVVRRLRMPLEGLDLLCVVIIAALVSAVLLGGGGTLYFALSKGTALMLPFREWIAAIFVGVCITLPMLAVWVQFRPRRSMQRNVRRESAGAAAFAAMIVLTAWLFSHDAAQWLGDLHFAYPLYLPILCVVIVAVVSGARGGTLAVFVLTLICLTQTSDGEGPFATQSASSAWSLFQAQLYVGVTAMLVLVVYALREAEMEARLEAERWRTDLELALAGSAQIAYLIDPRTQIVQWRGDVEGLLGFAAESLSNVERVLAYVDPIDRVRLSVRWNSKEQTSDASEPVSFRFATRFTEGGSIELLDRGSLLSDDNGQVAFAAGVWQRRSTVPS